ncbi:MAG: (d)CMP kinase [Bergeyella sp.]
MRKLVIAVDGYSSTGKSSISKVIAQKLGLVHLDTGALYRGVTLYALRHCLGTDNAIDFQKLFEKFNEVKLEFRNENGEMLLFLNGENISHEIRHHEISAQVSNIAKQKEVRDFLLDTQRKMAENGGVIMDGRDIGTVILPDADYKFFLTASPDERARRRFLELQHMGEKTDFQTVKENLIRRDKIDSEREIAPLKQADGAILIDNTHLNKEETVAIILSKIQ